MRVGRIRAWAAGKPGFEEIWIDREHLGWVTVAFSVDAEARQAELEETFPDVGAGLADGCGGPRRRLHPAGVARGGR